LVVLVRFAYLAVSNTFAALRLFPMGSREKDAEILALRHQLRVLQRQLGSERVRFERADRALLAALLGTLPRRTLRQQMLIIGERHLRAVPQRYVDYYNRGRSHQSTGWNCGHPATTRT